MDHKLLQVGHEPKPAKTPFGNLNSLKGDVGQKPKFDLVGDLVHPHDLLLLSLVLQMVQPRDLSHMHVDLLVLPHDLLEIILMIYPMLLAQEARFWTDVDLVHAKLTTQGFVWILYG